MSAAALGIHMGYCSGLLGIGAFNSDLMDHLEYAPQCYATVPIGTKALVSLFDRDTSSHFARNLSRTCGVTDYRYQQRLRIENINLPRLQELAWECSVNASDRDHFTDFLKLSANGFRFYYLPDRLFETNRRFKSPPPFDPCVGSFVSVGPASDEVPGNGTIYWDRQLDVDIVTALRWYFNDETELTAFCRCLAINPRDVASHTIDITKLDKERLKGSTRQQPAAGSGWKNRDRWFWLIDDLSKLAELGFTTWLVVDMINMYRPDGIAPNWPEDSEK